MLNAPDTNFSVVTAVERSPRPQRFNGAEIFANDQDYAARSYRCLLFYPNKDLLNSVTISFPAATIQEQPECFLPNAEITIRNNLGTETDEAFGASGGE